MISDTVALTIWSLKLIQDEIYDRSDTEILFSREVSSDSVVEMSDDNACSPNLDQKKRIL